MNVSAKSGILLGTFCLGLLLVVSGAPTTSSESKISSESELHDHLHDHHGHDHNQDGHDHAAHDHIHDEDNKDPETLITTESNQDESATKSPYNVMIDPLLKDEVEDEMMGTAKTKRQWYDHSHCYHDHCHDYYSDGHSHVRYYNRGWGWGRRGWFG